MQRVETMMRKDNRSITGKMSLLWSECNFVTANIVQTTPDVVPKCNRILSIFVRVTIIIHICNSISILWSLEMEKGTWCTMLILNTWTCVWISVFKDPSLITSKWFKVNSSFSPLCNQHTLTGWLPVIVARSVMSVPSSTWQSCRGSMKAGGSKLLLEESGENSERENRDETRDEQMRYYVYNDSVSVTQPIISL